MYKHKKFDMNRVNSVFLSERNNELEGQNIHTNDKVVYKDEFEVKRIIAKRKRSNKTEEFLVEWEGYSLEHVTWEPHSSFRDKDAKHLVRELKNNPNVLWLDSNDEEIDPFEEKFTSRKKKRVKRDD